MAAARGRPPSARKGARSLPQALVDRASELLLQKGHEALSLRAIAAAAGVSHVAALHHFASHEALLAAVAVRGFDALLDAVEEAARGGTPRTAFRRAGEAYVRWALTHANLYRLMFASRLRSATRHEELELRANRLFEIMSKLVAERRAARRRGSGPVEAEAFFAWATAHGATLLLLDEQAHLKALAPYAPADLVAVALDRVGRD
ncbi:MAG: TetR/AcrR family transcriptional regulator [Deltaproteobacteria bacterium]|nr:TetR/AcrR family transcriptional regulator [Deltaproteobacteria bacterium]